jgi:probable rRNA maturation factor
VSLAVVVGTDGVRIPIARGRLEAVARSVLRAEGVTHALLSVTFVTRSAIARLNRRFLQRRGGTDVIAFALRPTRARAACVGDVYIAPDVARRNARAYGVGLREELMRLVIHGTLHVLGYDHPDGAARASSPMWRRQEELLSRVLRRSGR